MAQYFGAFHWGRTFGEADGFVCDQLIRHLKRRSQRGVHPPQGQSWYSLIRDPHGVYRLSQIGWYNSDHHHSSLGLLTPADVHFQRSASRLAVRDAALDAAFAVHPERFVRGAPRTQRPPTAVWINPPAPGTTTPLTQAAESDAH